MLFNSRDDTTEHIYLAQVCSRFGKDSCYSRLIIFLKCVIDHTDSCVIIAIKGCHLIRDLLITHIYSILR